MKVNTPLGGDDDGNRGDEVKVYENKNESENANGNGSESGSSESAWKNESESENDHNHNENHWIRIATDGGDDGGMSVRDVVVGKVVGDSDGGNLGRMRKVRSHRPFEERAGDN